MNQESKTEIQISKNKTQVREGEAWYLPLPSFPWKAAPQTARRIPRFEWRLAVELVLNCLEASFFPSRHERELLADAPLKHREYLRGRFQTHLVYPRRRSCADALQDGVILVWRVLCHI